MDKIRLGKTELMVSATSFGALPLQRISKEDAVYLLRKAYDNEINYFDTANGYTDSEEKLGIAFEGIRDKVIISTKSHAKDYDSLIANVELSLKRLKTDYIDLLQLHNPFELPDTEDPKGPYAAMLEVKKRGMVRHIGITNHSFERAKTAVLSGKYETLQFPFSYLADKIDVELAELTHSHDMGFIAMKALAGGLITNDAAAFAFMKQYPYVVPIWGVQREWELDHFIEYAANPPAFDDAVKAMIAEEKKALEGNFCRACGYCLPCPAEIYIPTAARMSLLLRRSPYQAHLTQPSYDNMMRIKDCEHCNHCKDNCPYGLDTPNLLIDNLTDYEQFYKEHINKI